jgi:anti-anti-sigma regulatory factor
MTATITTSASDCGRAQIRSHFRHLATVVTIDGEIDAANVDPIVAYMRRMILAADPLVLDISGAKSSAAQCFSLLCLVAEDCARAGVAWTLVASPLASRMMADSGDEAVFPVARSVHEALHRFADGIDRRRQLLLPLVRKSA